MRIEKYEATGNDFLLVGADDAVSYLTNCRTGALSPESVQQLCDRHYGIGADGLMVVEGFEGMPSDRFFWKDECMLPRYACPAVSVQFYNADGSEAAFCGNGARCVARYAQRRGWLRRIDVGPIISRVVAGGAPALSGALLFGTWLFPVDVCYDGLVRVGVAKPTSSPERVSLADGGEALLLNTGVWHCVVCCAPGTLDARFEAEASSLRHVVNAPQGGANVDFYEVLQVDGEHEEYQVRMRTFEKGVEGETLSCGSGAVAVARACCIDNSYLRTVRVIVPGGELSVCDSYWLEGPARFVFGTEWGSK